MITLGSSQTGGMPSKTALITASCLSLFILLSGYFSLSSHHVSSWRSSHHDSTDVKDTHSGSARYGQQSLHSTTDEPPEARLDNVRNRTLGFGKIFVASMRERSDRRDALALAAAGTGIDLTFVDGVRRDEIPDKALPPLQGFAKEGWLNGGTIGAWRTHANILREIVQSGIGSAFVFEEDGDWDVRIKDSLWQVAQATRALVQPLESGSVLKSDSYDSNHTSSYHTYADPTYPHVDMDVEPEPMIYGDLPKTKSPKHSPYGDGWDMIHVGHCGLVSPQYPDPHLDDGLRRWTPKGHVMIEDDPTVPEPHYIHSVDEGNYPSFREFQEGVNHTRVVHHSMKFICSHGFAISQAGARRLLHYVGVRALDFPFDKMIENYCQDTSLMHKRGACLGTQPPMIAQHRPAGEISKDFEIESAWFADHHGQTREKGFSDNIRYSAMLNMDRMINDSDDFEDQYPDTV